jgi:hypothetical protein
VEVAAVVVEEDDDDAVDTDADDAAREAEKSGASQRTGR